MKIKDIYESTTAGSVASVAMPVGETQKRGYNLLSGKKTSKKYTNSVNESKMKELAMDLKDLDNGNFQKKYKKSKSQMKAELGDPESKKTVHEADLQEDDLILVPGQGHKLKSGFIPHGESRIDHEVEMARSDLFSAAKNAKQVYELIADLTEEEGLEGWVQEKIIKANDYLNTIREYLEGKQLQNEVNGGVIAGGAGNFEEAAGQKYEMRFKNGKTQRFVAATPEEAKNKAKGLGATSLIKVSKDGMPQGKVLEGEKPGLWANIHAKRERIKHGSGERMRKPGSKGAPTAQNFRDAAK